MKFSIKDFLGTADLVTFTEEILNGKFHFLCSVSYLFFSGMKLGVRKFRDLINFGLL